MIKQKKPTGFIISILMIFCFTAPVTISQVSESTKTINIAVVRDGQSEALNILNTIKAELDHLLGEEYTAVFNESANFDAGWQSENFRKVIENALSDEDIDIILGIGSLVTQEAASADLQLTKPFVSATILNGDAPPLPYSKDDRSLKENLSLVILPESDDEDIRVFKSLIHFDSLYIGLGIDDYQYVKNLTNAIEGYEDEYKVEIILLPVSQNIESTLNELNTNVEAFYLHTTPRLSTEERGQFVDSLTNRGIPVFSSLGLPDIELGVFATNKPDMIKESARRVSINLFRLIRGEKVSDLPVLLGTDFKLQINGKTAAEIGYYPDYNTRVSATIFDREYLEGDVRELSLKESLKLAAEGNASLTVSSSEVQTVFQESKVVQGFLFPQLGLDANYNHVDWNSLNQLVPKNFANFGVNISQMVYDDEVISDLSSANSVYEAAEFRFESDKLDIYFDAGISYLNYVQSRLFHQVSLDNLRLTEGNLEIAQTRVDVGDAGRDEVFRWETQLANSKADVLDAEATIEEFRIALNQVLGLNQAIVWMPEEMPENTDEYYLFQTTFKGIFEDRNKFENFVNASINYSLHSSPELQFLNKTIEAQDIQIGQEKRSFFLPKIYADFNYGNNFWQNPEIPKMDPNGFNFGVSARLALFEGTSKIHRIQREESVLKELTNTVNLTKELLEQRTRTSIRRLQSSFPNISYFKSASESAKLNLGVVREKYANGIVNITELLDAQNSSFVADQNSISAIYNFLRDLIEYQRAISFFEETKTREEKDEFLLKFYNNENQ
jgi:outer membrane protein